MHREKKIARHVAEGARVGLCDLTRGELGSNGTPEERLREAFAHAPVGMVLTDPDGRYLYTNRAYQEIVGYSEQELRRFMQFQRHKVDHVLGQLPTHQEFIGRYCPASGA